jgi:hypothetical protein
VQQAVGNRVAETPVDYIPLTVSGEVCFLFCWSSPIIVNQPVFYTGQTSFQKAILNQGKVDQDKPDPSPCDPNKNEDNNASQEVVDPIVADGIAEPTGSNDSPFVNGTSYSNWVNGFVTKCGYVVGGYTLQCETFPV